MNPQIKVDRLTDPKYVQMCVNKYLGLSGSSTNSNGEEVTVIVRSDSVEVTTFQHNRWVRQNIYWTDGTVEEMFDGRW